jgi:hypothetical protein
MALPPKPSMLLKDSDFAACVCDQVLPWSRNSLLRFVSNRNNDGVRYTSAFQIISRGERTAMSRYTSTWCKKNMMPIAYARMDGMV